MRYNKLLGRRLAKLETVFVLPTEQDKEDALQIEALLSLPYGDIAVLREIVLVESAGGVVERTPEKREVAARWNETFAAVQAKYAEASA